MALFALAFVFFFAGPTVVGPAWPDLGDAVGRGLVWTATALIPVLAIDVIRVSISDRKASDQGARTTFDEFH